MNGTRGFELGARQCDVGVEQQPHSDFAIQEKRGDFLVVRIPFLLRHCGELTSGNPQAPHGIDLADLH